MKLKAKIKWSGEEVKVKPVYFSWHVPKRKQVMNFHFSTMVGMTANGFGLGEGGEFNHKSLIE